MPRLSPRTLRSHPMSEFKHWYDVVVRRSLYEPNAMVLATATKGGSPAARVVLLKSFSKEGFVFFTNYGSRKGRELRDNPRAALVFYWPEVTRQIRVEGIVKKIGIKESDQYFRTRPLGAQLGAHASPQSAVVPGREYLEQRLKDVAQSFGNQSIMRPENWGGYRLCPMVLEFWQGRPDRLHDRFRYRFSKGRWIIEQLAP